MINPYLNHLFLTPKTFLNEEKTFYFSVICIATINQL
ncbi:hypothetical protein C8P67_103328 [Flavobacterium aquicola]|uniref:Uncharacterized protein n=1 Tax=Flavobacterium aquicola TaxID=1682742 RepID=A0A3E0EQF8_9FLAO|nr:hypothetical protein C8P67_103328 [Flavobacterium aquicola]